MDRAREPGFLFELKPSSPAPIQNDSATDSLSLCVLSSSSSGNCSALLHTRDGRRQLFLLDLGLSRRRTFRHLAEIGLEGVPIAGVLLTHLDTDHCSSSWLGNMPQGSRLHLHRRHRGRAERIGFLSSTCEIFENAFDLAPGLRVRPLLQSHDDLGVAAFRFEMGSANRSLGFATDVGRAGEELVRHLSGVEVLAIESNYCPRMQIASPRPEFLKRRIMGGSGHLSNRECADATRLINPSRHVVLLHLSRQCNTPELAATEHKGRSYQLTLARPDAPTPWITIAPSVPALA